LDAHGSEWISGKTVMITGANSGIGKSASTGLAKMGANVVMVCRDQSRGEEARKEIINASGASTENISLMLADLASLDSVRKLAADFGGTGKPLHVLLNNAGLILGKRTVTKDGFETTFEVNYLSHFLLTDLLLPKLKANAPSRIINVSSDAHTGGHMDFADLQEEKNYGALRSYSQSKLAQVLFTYELAKRLSGTGVTANCVHPGVVATNWGRHSAGALSVGLRLGSVFMMKSDKGADTLVYLSSSPEVSDVTGKYFTKRRAIPSSAESMDETEAKTLWDLSMKMCGLEDGPGD
jgi:NAD(P)-dependent dehydrogenase (short-subunit alcohol dehydrogenase family)